MRGKRWEPSRLPVGLKVRIVVATLGLLLGVGWAVVLVGWPQIVQALSFELWINGWAVAVYGSMICFATRNYLAPGAGILCFFLGLLHGAWIWLVYLLAIVPAMIINAVAPQFAGSDTFLLLWLFLGTGVVFAVPIWMASRSWVVGLSMVGVSIGAAMAGQRIEVGQATLHVGIAGCFYAGFLLRMFAPARRRAATDRCLECGYPRTGLRAGAVCPECGTKQASMPVNALTSAGRPEA